MIYIVDDQLAEADVNWKEVIAVLERAIGLLYQNDYSQPVKPYLRFKNPLNRIIAMPGYLGGDFDLAGIKWIASFPDNLLKDIPRAHSVTILNDAETGAPLCIINSAKVSSIRTAGISGVIIAQYVRQRALRSRKFHVGIVGFGPIGRMHLRMLCALFADQIQAIYLYDLRAIDLQDVDEIYRDKVVIAQNWEAAYVQADIFLTCTVSKERYINLPPKQGSVHLNVSLRDYHPEVMQLMTLLLVDDWEEVCRENTDIEHMHLRMGLSEGNVYSFRAHQLTDVFSKLDEKDTLMFNPMGMSVFDIAIASMYYRAAQATETDPMRSSVLSPNLTTL